jgi:hypothetical protein
METNKFIIDKVLGIEVLQGNYFNEISTLLNLKYGLALLYNTVRPMELKIIEENKGSDWQFFGNHPTVPREFSSLLPCLFHWFGTSVCNYARLTGYIVRKHEGIITDDSEVNNASKRQVKEACDSYLKSVNEISEVLKWRNKIGAHFALTDPRSDDNIATLEASIIYPVGFSGGRYRTSNFSYARIEGDTSIVAEIPNWSLTETFEILCERFWPDVTPK